MSAGERKKKMRQLSTLAAFFVVGTVIALSTAYAEIITVESKITEIDTSSLSKSIGIYHLDSQTGKTEEIKVEVSDSTLFGDVESLQGLKVGDEIIVEADYNAFTHDWKAQSIKRLKPT